MHRSEALANLTSGVKRLFALVEDGTIRRLLRAEPRPDQAARPPQRRLSSELIEVISREYAAGSTVYELAAQHGIHRDLVSKAVHEAGFTMRNRAMSAYEVSRVRELAERGMSWNAIGLAIGRDPKTVKAALLPRL